MAFRKTIRLADMGKRSWTCSIVSAMPPRRRRRAGASHGRGSGGRRCPARLPPTSRSPGKDELPGSLGPGDRGVARDRAGHRPPLRRARRSPHRDRLPAQRPGRGGDRRPAARARGRTRPGSRQRRLRAHCGRGLGAGTTGRRGPQRRHRSHPPGPRDRGQALRLDAGRERARLPLARPRSGPGHALRLVSRRRLQPGFEACPGELRPRRNLEGGPGGARPLPRGRARAPGDPGQRRLRRRGRDGGARLLPQPGADAQLLARTDTGRPARGTGRPGGRHRAGLTAGGFSLLA